MKLYITYQKLHFKEYLSKAQTILHAVPSA